MRVLTLLGFLFASLLTAVPARAAALLYEFTGTAVAADGTKLEMVGGFGFDPAQITTTSAGQVFAYSDPTNSDTPYALLTAYGDTLSLAFTNQGLDQSVTIEFATGFLSSTLPTSTIEGWPGNPIDFSHVTSAFFTGAYAGADPPVSGEVTGLTVVLFSDIPPALPPSGQLRVQKAPPVVPEPSTWVTMLLGFAAVGLAVRRRQTSVLA